MITRSLGSNGPSGLRARPRLHGHVRLLRPGRRGREHRHDPRRARRRHHAARHRRLLRHGPQRAADRRGARAGATASRSCSASSSARCAIPTAAGSASTRARPRSRTSSPTRCRGSAPTTSTSTARPGSTRACRSRTPSARSPSWSRPATCATSASRRSAPRRIRRAHAVHPIADLQIEYSLISRGIEDEILPTCRELGIGITAYGVLSRGLLSGHWSKDRPLTPGDFRSPRAPLQRREPRPQPRAGRGAARGRRGEGRDVAQVAIAWVLAQGADIVPLVGARRRDRLTEALGALAVELEPCRSRRHRTRRAARRRRRRALRRPADGDPRQRTGSRDGRMSEAALTPDRILDAAEEVLTRFGPAKATVVDVARALGVSHGSVYRHFPSKAALRDAVTERWLARVSAPLAAIVAEDGPAPERLRRWFDLLIAQAAEGAGRAGAVRDLSCDLRRVPRRRPRPCRDPRGQ